MEQKTQKRMLIIIHESVKGLKGLPKRKISNLLDEENRKTYNRKIEEEWKAVIGKGR